MQQSIELAKKITKDYSKDWSSEIEDAGLHKVFQPVYGLKQPIEVRNKIVCFIIYSMSPDSGWLDLKKDRYENKKKILSHLDADVSKKIFLDVLEKRNEMVSIATFNFLEELKDWRWGAVYDYYDFSARLFRFASEKTEEEKVSEKKIKGSKDGEKEIITEGLGIEIVAKIEAQKGLLLGDAVKKRREGDALLAEIEKDFVTTDHATQSDYSFKFSDTSKKKDVLSWRTFIAGDAKILKEKNHITKMFAQEPTE